MRVANNNAISTTLIHWGCILSPFMLKFTKILQKIFCIHIFFPDKFIKSRAMNEREMSSDISGGIFLPHGVNSTSDWLPRYKHRVPVPVLWPFALQNSEWWELWDVSHSLACIHQSEAEFIRHFRNIAWHLSLVK